MLVDLWRSVDPIDPIYNKVYFSNSLCLCVSIKKRTQAFPKEMETLEPVCYGVSD